MSQPTNAQRLTTFLKYSEGTSASRQNGSRVNNIKAARIRSMDWKLIIKKELEIFGDGGLLEAVHLVDHADCRVHNRIGAYGAGTFTQA